MDLAPLEISPDEAREKLDEYQESLRHDRNAEDEAIAAAYRAAARGLPVISLPRAIGTGGFFPDGNPKLAVIAATAAECFVRWDNGALVYSTWDSPQANRGSLVGKTSVRVPLAPDDRPAGLRRRWESASTVVPLVPPAHRLHLRRMNHCHILWEVESWTQVPPRDPALIRHIRGDLWAVLSVWDLTELERLVLSQRMTR